MDRKSYDIIIVGAGVAGSALAHALSTLPRSKPLRIALVERSLAEPDRIVGELLQPGGVLALKKLGIDWCLEGIDAVTERGYCVVESGKSVCIPYPEPHEGRSFHHGRFIMRLREAAGKSRGVEILEGTVTGLIEAGKNKKVAGVKITRKGGNGTTDVKDELFADVTIIADGCFSNFRNTVMGSSTVKVTTKSHFFGAILEDAKLPIPNYGTVALVHGYGPVLLYQIGSHETRILIDLKTPLPADPKTEILENIVPQLPSSLHLPIQAALEKERLRRMPNSFLPPVEQGTVRSKEGAILIGDSWNMRHPLTGGGMTVALNDVVLLRDLLGSVSDLSDWRQVRKVLHRWHWTRKPLSSTVNILSVALYDLFGADGEELRVLRTGCFKYFERGEECINGPVSLLSGVAPDPALLAYHFFSVAFYAIWIMFVDSREEPRPSLKASGHLNCNEIVDGEKLSTTRHGVLRYPCLMMKAIRVFWTSCIVFGPLLWSEVDWWSPADTSKRIQLIASAIVPIVFLSIATMYGLPSVAFLGIK